MQYAKNPKLNGYAQLLFVILISFIYIYYTFGIDFILGNASYWQTQRGDLAQHLSGINMYLDAPWQFPLLAFNTLNYPIGTRITFLDGIPILSFALKLILPKDHGWINPLGYWIALCFLLQGFSAWWITKELKIKSWLFLLFLTLTFLTLPELIDRLDHTALMSQWTILFAIALYINNYRKKKISITKWAVLIIVTFYIHIYLFAMISLIYLALLYSLNSEKNTRHTFQALIPYYIWLASLFIFFLPVPNGNLHKGWGFGIYSMNLLSPILGGKLLEINATIMPGQYEGFNYLGLGAIILIVSAMLFYMPDLRILCRKHRALLIVMLLMWLYALSDQLYFGKTLIAKINYPGFLYFLFGEFRSSGRFFWPVAYAAVILSLYINHQKMQKKRFIVFASILLAIQLVDTWPLYQHLRILSTRQAYASLNFNKIDSAIANKNTIYFYPKYDCQYSDSTYNELLALMTYAAHRHLRLNTAMIARYSGFCNNFMQEINSSDKKNSIYIFSKGVYPYISTVYNMLGGQNAVSCESIENLYICEYNRKNKK